MKNKMKWVFLFLGLLLISATIWFFYFKTEKTKYTDVQIKKGSIVLKVVTTGTAQPENRLVVKPSAAGRAEQILVDVGVKVRKGQVLAWTSSSERAIILDTARAQGAEEVKKWEDIYKPTPITAPISGTVISRQLESGQSFTSGDTVFIIADKLMLQAQVDETDLAQITKGQKARVVFDAYADKPIEAIVKQIAYEAKTVNNVTTYNIEISLNEVGDFLRSGMTATVTLFGQAKENILLVSNEYIKYDNGKPQILVKTNTEKPEAQDIKIGITDGKMSEVLEGLAENQTVYLAEVRDAKAKSNIFSGAQKKTGSGGGGPRKSSK